MSTTTRIINTTARMGATVISNGILHSEFSVEAVSGVTHDRAMELLSACKSLGIGADATPGRGSTWDVCCGLSQRERVQSLASPNTGEVPEPITTRRVRREIRLARKTRTMMRAYARGYRLG